MSNSLRPHEAYQSSPSMGFSRQEYPSGLPFPSSGALPDPGIKPWFPALQADALPSETPGKPMVKGEFNAIKRLFHKGFSAGHHSADVIMKGFNDFTVIKRCKDRDHEISS